MTIRPRWLSTCPVYQANIGKQRSADGRPLWKGFGLFLGWFEVKITLAKKWKKDLQNRIGCTSRLKNNCLLCLSFLWRGDHLQFYHCLLLNKLLGKRDSVLMAAEAKVRSKTPAIFSWKLVVGARNPKQKGQSTQDKTLVQGWKENQAEKSGKNAKNADFLETWSRENWRGCVKSTAAWSAAESVGKT